MNSPLRVAIAGGGFSGTLVAVHLLRQDQAVHIDLIEARPAGRGLAFSTLWDEHLLNVPAVRMSAFGSEPMHFLEWLRANGKPDSEPDLFAQRRVYGTYLQHVLQQSVTAARGRSRLRQHFSEAVDVPVTGRLVLANGDTVEADKVVLALGNPEYAPMAGAPSIWEPGALAGLDPEAEVLLIGAALTAVDTFLALLSQGHRGRIHIVSRHGKLPHAHAFYRPLTGTVSVPASRTARGLLHEIRKRVREEKADWRATIDSFRGATNEVWIGLGLAEQRRVVRHLKTYWDIHRHRIAPEIGTKLQAAVAHGQLVVHAGRLQSWKEGKVQISLRAGGDLSLTVGRVFNCTGSNQDYRRNPDQLIASLLSAGRIRPNLLGRGLETTANGELVGADGAASDHLFTLGPPRIGGLLETIAVPELRLQAQALANFLTSTFYEPVDTPVEQFMAAGI